MRLWQIEQPAQAHYPARTVAVNDWGHNDACNDEPQGPSSPQIKRRQSQAANDLFT
nr:unnamed protein product [Digitaria exilis]